MPGIGRLNQPALAAQDAGMNAGRDDEGLAQPPVLDGLFETGLGRLGDVDRHFARAGVAGSDHASAMERPDGIDGQVDHGVGRVAFEVQQRAELQDDAFLDLVGLGLEPGSGAAFALKPAGEGSRFGGLDRQGLAVDHFDPLVGQLAESLLNLHLRKDQRRVVDPHGPDLLALGAAADEREPVKNRISPAGIDRGDELDVNRQDVFDGVGEALDDLVDLLEHFGRVVRAELGAGGGEDGDLVAVPFGEAGPLEDPVDDRFLRIGLVAGGAGVSRDRVSAPLEAGLGGERRRAPRRPSRPNRRASSSRETPV